VPVLKIVAETMCSVAELLVELTVAEGRALLDFQQIMTFQRIITVQDYAAQ
jgi:hypothetical protein